MDNAYFAASASFMVGALFGLYILAVMLRLLLQWARADFYNPISQFLVKITNPVVIPLRRVLPSIGKIDTASIVVLVALQMVERMLQHIIVGQNFTAAGLAVDAGAELLALLLNVFIFSILIQVIFSWLGPGTYNPLTGLLHYLTEPVLGPVRRFVPTISGIDLSPLFALLGLQLLKILLVAPIADLGRALGHA